MSASLDSNPPAPVRAPSHRLNTHSQDASHDQPSSLLGTTPTPDNPADERCHSVPQHTARDVLEPLLPSLPHDTSQNTSRRASQDLTGHEIDPESDSTVHSPRRSSVASFDSLEQRPPISPPPPSVKAKFHQHDNTSQAPGGALLPRSIWTMELVSCLIAFCCLGAIVGVLYVHQGKTLPQWPLSITINALVSVFTSIFKAALIMPVTEGWLVPITHRPCAVRSFHMLLFCSDSRSTGISQFKWLWFSLPRQLVDLESFDKASRGVWGSVNFLCGRLPRLGTM